MKVVADVETGDLYEALPADLVGAEPYDYAQYRRAQMAATREHRQALREKEQAVRAAAAAEARYREALAKAIVRYKAEHGATVAPDLAKGDPEVSRLREERDVAAGLVDAATERLRLCQADRAALNRMGEWSREADPDGWRHAP